MLYIWKWIEKFEDFWRQENRWWDWW
jgi:hypothetical protein